MSSMLYMIYEVMNILLKKKEIEMIVKDKGLNFNQWKDDVVNSARMSIIDKQGEEYKDWETQLLEKKAIELLMNQTTKDNQNNKVVQQKQNTSNEFNKQMNQEDK